jgi:hypothetical protein
VVGVVVAARSLVGGGAAAAEAVFAVGRGGGALSSQAASTSNAVIKSMRNMARSVHGRSEALVAIFFSDDRFLAIVASPLAEPHRREFEPFRCPAPRCAGPSPIAKCTWKEG